MGWVRRQHMAFALLGGLSDCDLFNGDGSWTRYSASDESVVVVVSPDATADGELTLTLTSTTGTVEVATARVSPASGPVGTEHVVTVDVFDDFVEDIGRVTVDADAGDRGSERFELVQDSADDAHWQVAITSMGVDGEAREDVFTFALWEPASSDAAATDDTGASR